MLAQALGSDPFDLCFEQSSEMLGQRVAVAAPRPGIRQRIGRLWSIPMLALSVLKGDTGRSSEPVRDRLFFVASSDNHVHAIRPVLERLGEGAVLGESRFNERLQQRGALWALPFVPVLTWRCLRASAQQRSTLAASLHTYWLAYGLFVAAAREFAKAPPSLVVLGSDHAFLPRVVGAAARFCGVPTAFIPHDGVTRGLPPLEFDYAFLDGVHMARAYRQCGPSTTSVLLAGVPRLDPVIQHRRAPGRRLALCPALRDDATAVLELLEEAVRVLSPDAVSIRPHPREPMRERYVAAARNFGCRFSDARVESAGDFLKWADIVVCGDSNLLAEARVARRWVVFFDPNNQSGDQYGYIADGLPHACCRNGAELLAFLSNDVTRSVPSDLSINALMATIGTCWEGRSGELVSLTLSDLAAGRSFDATVAWRTLEDAQAGRVFAPPRL